MINDYKQITPVEKIGGLYFKRDDLFNIGGMSGAKVRACYILGKMAKDNGYKILTTAGAKSSPQINIVATIGKELGLEVVGHTSDSKLQPDMISAIEKGARVEQHSYGYTTVLMKRTKDFAEQNNAFIIPYGMESEASINSAKKQLMGIDKEVFKEIKRIVIPVGSGINAIGVVLGLDELGLDIPVLGVQVGASPKTMFDRYLNVNNRKRITLIKAKQKYNSRAEYTIVNGVEVDSYYEGKCIPFLEKGDLFWIVGKKEHYVKGKSIEI